MFPGERLLVRLLRRQYVHVLRTSGGQADTNQLAAGATARLSIDGMHRLREQLVDERARARELGEHRLADGLTSAVRQLDSRVQILDDLLR